LATIEALHNGYRVLFLLAGGLEIDAQDLHSATTLVGWFLSPISIKGAGEVEVFSK